MLQTLILGQGAGPLDSDVGLGTGHPGPGQLTAVHGYQIRGLRAPRGTAHRTLPLSTGCCPVLGLPWLPWLGAVGRAGSLRGFWCQT